MTFSPRSPLVWSLGPVEAPDLSLNGIDEHGIEWACERPDGWDELAPELPTEQSAGDGGWFGPGRWPSRVLTIRGAFRKVVAGADLDAAEDRLRAAVERITSDQLLWVTEPRPKQVTVRQSGPCSVPRLRGQTKARPFSVILTAADPYKYAAGPDGVETVTLRLGSPVVDGLVFPAVAPFSFGSATSENRQTTDNPGRAVYPISVLTGPAPEPRLTNATTGEYFALSVALAAGSQAVIDHRARTLRIDGVSRLNARAPGSDFFALAPGRNDLRFTAGAFDPAASAVLTYRPRWR